MESFKDYNKMLEEGLKKVSLGSKPDTLYDPVKYILDMGGKRVRPVLALMACSSFGSNPNIALKAELSVELFHNFTLIHATISNRRADSASCSIISGLFCMTYVVQ